MTTFPVGTAIYLNRYPQTQLYPQAFPSPVASPQPEQSSLTALPAFPRVYFGTPIAEKFNYERYADLMIDYSIGGIKPGETTVIWLAHQDIPKPVQQLYKDLVVKGYTVSFSPTPQAILDIFRESPRFSQLETRINRDYTHVFEIHDSSQEWPKNLQNLLKREAQPNESVRLVVATRDNDKLAEALARRIVNSNGTPFLIGESRHTDDILPTFAKRPEQVTFLSPEWQLYRQMRKFLQVDNKPALATKSAVIAEGDKRDPEIDRLYRSTKQQFVDDYWNRMGRLELGNTPGENGFNGFLRSRAISPSVGAAEDCGMSFDRFGRFYSDITYLERPDIIEFYRNEAAKLDQYARQLRQYERFRVSREDGKTDIIFSIRERQNKESRYVAPSGGTGNALLGEIFTSPIENSANGKLYFDIPFTFKGQVFNHVTTHVKDGQLIDLSVDHTEDNWQAKEAFLKSHFIKGGQNYVAGLDYLGEFAIAGKFINPRISEGLAGYPTRNTLIGEKQDIHFAWGSGYPITGGTNRSEMHVDLCLQSSEGSGLVIEAFKSRRARKPVVIYQNGQFTPAFLQGTSLNVEG